MRKERRDRDKSLGNGIGEIVNVPNILTVLRVLLVPALVVFLLERRCGAALVVFLVAGVSDALDGFIARHFNLCTRFGAMLDPLADKLLVISSTFLLSWIGLLPWWLFMVIVARDAIIVGGAAAYYRRAGALEMSPSIPSKANTFVQISLVLLILAHGAGLVDISAWLATLYGVALVTAVISGVHYVVVWGRKAGGINVGRT